MSTRKNVEFITPPNDLKKAIVGDGPARMDPTLLAKAEAVVEQLEVEFPDWAGDYVSKMRQLLRDAQADPARKDQAIAAMFTQAMDLKGQAGSYGYEMITAVGDCLKDFTQTLSSLDDRAVRVIEAHIDAMEAVLRDRLKGDGGEIGREIVRDLEKLVGREDQ